MSKFLLPILAGIAMVIVSGCGGAGAPSTDDETNDSKIASAQIEAQRLINERLKAEITACGGTCAGYAEWLTANPNLPTVPIETINEISDKQYRVLFTRHGNGAEYGGCGGGCCYDRDF